MSGTRAPALLAVALVLALTAGAAGVVGIAGTAAAGDAPTILEVAPDEHDAEPGEEIELAVEMASHGGYGDVGVESVSIAVGYDADALTVTDAERGPWLEQDEETTVESEVEIDDEDGTVTVEQWRSPAAGGATGYDDLVVLTLAVADGAAGNHTISVDEASVRLANDQPQPAISRNGTVSVGESADGGDAAVESEDAPGVGLLGAGMAVALVVVGAAIRRHD